MKKTIKLGAGESIINDLNGDDLEVKADCGNGVAIALLSGTGLRRDADINVYLCRMDDGRLDVIARDNASDWGVITDDPDGERAAEIAHTVDLDEVEDVIRKIANGREEYIQTADAIKSTANLAERA